MHVLPGGGELVLACTLTLGARMKESPIGKGPLDELLQDLLLVEGLTDTVPPILTILGAYSFLLMHGLGCEIGRRRLIDAGKIA